MKTFFLFLIFTFTFVGCGKDNSSGGDNTSNGVDSTTRYTQMATTPEENSYMYEAYGELALQVMKNRKFYLLRQTRRGLDDIMSGTWSVNGTYIVLDRIGTGHYLESNDNGVIFDCLYFDAKDLTPKLTNYLRNTNIPLDRMLKFCKRR